MEETEQADEATAKHAAERAERQAKHAAAERQLQQQDIFKGKLLLKNGIQP